MFEWIHQFDFFLFDFDGLLVNTEELHYQAYKQMCSDRGIVLDWDFNRYCNAAHYEADAVKEQLYAEYPALFQQEPDWNKLYAEKKRNILRLLNEGAVHTMPGVDELLSALHKATIRRCVVTHSPDDLVQTVIEKNPILKTIPYWVTREHYSTPKPNPECYLKAIELYAKPGDRIIGFEDTPRGMEALLGAPAKRVLVCSVGYPEILAFRQKGVLHFSSFEHIENVL